MTKRTRSSMGRRFILNESGGISIFLALVMLATIILGGLLVDVARIGSAKNQTARALDLAALSVLSGYESDLKEEYKLFAIDLPTPDTGTLNKYTNANLGIEEDDKDFLDYLDTRDDITLYKFKTENIFLETSMPLSNVDALERQILEHMKYRAPLALITGVAAQLKQVKSASKMAAATKIKVKIDRKLGKIGESQQKLRDYLYGDTDKTDVGDYYVRKLTTAADDKYREQLNELFEKYESYVLMKKTAYENALARSKPDPIAAKNDKDAVASEKNEFDSAWATVNPERFGNFLDANNKAIICVETIENESEELLQLYDDLDKSLKEFRPEDGAEQLTAPILEDVSKGKAMLLDAQTAREITDKLKANVVKLEELAAAVKSLRQRIDSYTPPSSAPSKPEFQNVVNPDLRGYSSDISYDYQRAEKTGSFEDPREFLNDRVSELMKSDHRKGETLKEKKLSDIGIVASDLPSKKAERQWWDRFLGFDEDGETEYEPKNNDSEFSENALEGVGSLGSEIGDDPDNPAIAIRNGLYVGEYVLSIFNNAVKDEYRWAGAPPQEKRAFFDAEVEYILHGNDTQSQNLFWTKAQLLGTRFVMNFIHVHSDPEKLKLASATAASLAAAFTSGALIPIVTELIFASWSMKEAILDVEDLFDGKRVPFLKNTGDWKSIIGVSAEGKPKTKEENMWSYIDYLRIYLLPLPRETKLARINDLIEINTKHAGRELKTENLYCSITANIEVSINYLFMTAAFIPENMKTEKDRHILRATVTRDLF